jgi:hypothetical protein
MAGNLTRMPLVITRKGLLPGKADLQIFRNNYGQKDLKLIS